MNSLRPTYDQQHRELHSLEQRLYAYRQHGAEAVVHPKTVYRLEMEYSIKLMLFRRSGQWDDFREHLRWYKDYLDWQPPRRNH